MLREKLMVAYTVAVLFFSSRSLVISRTAMHATRKIHSPLSLGGEKQVDIIHRNARKALRWKIDFFRPLAPFAGCLKFSGNQAILIREVDISVQAC